MAILDIHDLGLAREQRPDLVGVMAIVQQPLAAVIARPGITRPRELEGRRVGVTGLPSDDAVLRSVVAGDGGDPARCSTTTIGFDAVKALLAGRVDAATAFWNVEGVALERRRPGFREFRVDDFGAPSYPELVLCATRDTIAERAPVVRATIRALQRGYQQAQADPESAIGAVLDANPDLSRDELRRRWTPSPRRSPPARSGSASCALPELRAWAAWDHRFGILSRPLDVGRAFDPRPLGLRRRPTSGLFDGGALRRQATRRSTSAAPSRAIRERGHRRGRSRRRRRAASCRRRRASRRRACASAQLAVRAQALDHRDAVEARAARSTISTAAPSGCASRRRRAAPRTGRAQHAEHVGAEQQVVEGGDDAGHATGRGCGGTPAAPTRGGPTSGSSRRGRCATRAAPARPGCRLRRAAERAVHGGRRGGVAELVGDEQLPVPVVVGVRLAR